MIATSNGIGTWLVVHMAGALVLGWIVGYERYFSGRAAGSQVYCLVSTTSCAITLLAGYPALWYWGSAHDIGGGDPTRVINAIMTGIGFLGAGIIVQSGLNVRGLTTAASIWGSAAIGILVGVGFYSAAIGLTVLFVVSLALVPRIEHRLPAQAAIVAMVRFREGYRPRPALIQRYLERRGMRIPPESVNISFDRGRFELRCLVFGKSVMQSEDMRDLIFDLARMKMVERFNVAHSSRA
jgi:putative Mg2+ transporter-C (MgtC) family protein